MLQFFASRDDGDSRDDEIEMDVFNPPKSEEEDYSARFSKLKEINKHLEVAHSFLKKLTDLMNSLVIQYNQGAIESTTMERAYSNLQTKHDDIIKLICENNLHGFTVEEAQFLSDISPQYSLKR